MGEVREADAATIGLMMTGTRLADVEAREAADDDDGA